jgi:tetratricopeptide (TPR) repeat protein
MSEYRYTAYLSYSHRDARWAGWLHRALERYRVPPRLEAEGRRIERRTLAPVFRDRDDLSSSADLEGTLGSALEASEHLVVLCSPESAQSRWVNEEIRSFRALGRGDRIHCVIVDGDPQAPPGEGGCFPPALFEGEAGGKEPLAADPREFADGKHLALLKVAAGLLGVPLDALRRRDLVRRRRVQSLAAVGALVMVVLVGMAVSARIAERQERAQAEQMASFIVDLGDDLRGDLDLESLGRMSATAIGYLDQIDPDRLSPESRIKVARALRQVGNVNWHQGAINDAQDAFQRSLDVFRSLADTVPATGTGLVNEVWFELSQAEFYLGYLLLEMGDIGASKPHFDQYLEIARTQHEAKPEDPRWHLEYSYATSALVNAGLNLREPVDAEILQTVERNLELAERALASNQEADRAEALAHYGNELAFAADAMLRACLLDEALETRQESLSIFEELFSATGEAADELQVALRHRGIGGVYSALGRLDEARTHQQAALDIFQRQFNRDPSNETNITDVASGHRRLGRLLVFTGEYEAAARHQRTARDLLTPMLGDDEVLTWQRDEFRALVLEEVARARLAGDRALALDLLDRYRPLLASTELGEDLSPFQASARVEFRYERWRLTGADPAAEESFLLQSLPIDLGEYTGCHEADLLARHGVMTGDPAFARNKVNYLASAGYREPGYLEFCRAEGLCKP